MEPKKAVRSRRKYDKDFKYEVLKMIQNGRPTREVAESLGIGENLIYRWKKQVNVPSSSQSKSIAPLPQVTQQEYEQLKTRLKEVEQERDILKKALGIFSRGN